MKKTSQILLGTVFLVLMLVTACGKKPIAIVNLQMIVTGAELKGTSIEQKAGTKAEIAINYEAEDFSVVLGEELKIPTSMGVTVQGNIVIVQATEAGTYDLPLTLAAKGYADTQYTLQIGVVLQQFPEPQIAIEKEDAISVEGNTITLVKGTQGALNFKVNPETAYTFDLVGDTFELTTDGSRTELVAKDVGTAQLNVTMKQEYYESKTVTYQLECILPQLEGLTELNFSEIEVGEKATVTTNFGDTKVNLTATANNENVATAIKSNKVVITGKTVGESTVTIVAKSDGYRDYEESIVISVTPPKPRLEISLSHTKLSLDVGKSQTISINNLPREVTVTAVPSGEVEVAVQDNTIAVTLTGAGGGKVTVSVAKEGYKSYFATVVVNKKTSTTSSNADYQAVLNRVNYYRTSEGLKPLVYRSDIDPLSKTRAKEIATLFEHARPGNKTWNSVFTEYGVSYKQVGENLARGTDPKLNDPDALVDAWMGSPSHRANIMSEAYEGMSVAKYVDENGKIHWAQLFITN